MTLLLFWTAALSSPISAQQARGLTQQDRPPTLTSPPEQGAAGVLADSSKDYLISPGDVIEIRVEDAAELSHHYRVSAAGDIEMPVLGRVAAMQKTTYELGRLIANMLREQEYLKNPSVVVNVRQYNSRAFFIQGAVGKPGLYQLEGRPSLLTLIGLAGGLADNHGSTVFILRPAKTQKQTSNTQDSNRQGQTEVSAPDRASKLNQGSPSRANDPDSETAADYELIKVNLTALYKGQFDQNQRLEPGDIVNIPRSDVFFVAGEVRAPGSFPLKDGTTLRQAISLAQGMTFKAKPSRGIIFREDPVAGSRQEIKIDISAIMDGKKEDILVRANDVIIVPNSRMKSVGGALLMTFGVNSIRFPLPY
jgi:polysaccharide export outer membrane protein